MKNTVMHIQVGGAQNSIRVPQICWFYEVLQKLINKQRYA